MRKVNGGRLARRCPSRISGFRANWWPRWSINDGVAGASGKFQYKKSAGRRRLTRGRRGRENSIHSCLHLQYGRYCSTRRRTLAGGESQPRLRGTTVHERTETDLLRRGEGPLAAHEPHHGNRGGLRDVLLIYFFMDPSRGGWNAARCAHDKRPIYHSLEEGNF